MVAWVVMVVRGSTITHANIVSVTDGGTGLSYIEPNAPSDSYLWHKINGTQSSVAVVKQNGEYFSTSDLGYIESLINGALISYTQQHSICSLLVWAVMVVPVVLH